MSNIITINKINKVYKQKRVLKDVSIEIPSGSIFAFLGSNGAGKSTLLNIITTILMPTSGEVFLNQKSLFKNKYLKGKIGIVFQENTFDDEFSIYENLMIRGKLYHYSKQKLNERIKELVDLFDMHDFLYHPYKICSGGQKRIAMIARALLINPKIIIMDEPTTALDIETRKKVWNVLLKLNRERKLTIFFSSHYIEEANLANYLCILKSGSIIFHGTYDQLMSKYNNKILNVEFTDSLKKIEVDTMSEALTYLNKQNINQIKTFSVSNNSLEEIFLKVIKHENINL